jgi:tetratricopeptide (TPR) repeat protein
MRTKSALFLLAVAVALLAGCAKPVGFDLEVRVLFDGKPVSGAKVVVSATGDEAAAAGVTGADGRFVQTLSRLPEKEIKLTVIKEGGKERTRAWEKTFTIKPRKQEAPAEKIAFTAELQRYIVVVATRDGQPVAGANVSVAGHDLGATPANGEVEYDFGKWPRSGLRISVKKEGFGETAFTYRGESGDRVNAGLYTEAVVTVEALEDRNSRIGPVNGAVVTLAGKRVGVTGANGMFTYHHQGTFGETVPLRISAAGHAPANVTRSVLLGGSHKVVQYFYPAAAEPLRTAVMTFAANTAGEDISDVVKKIQESFNDELFDSKLFKRVPAATALNLMKRSKLNLAKIKTTDWRRSELGAAVDVVVISSIARGEEDSYVIESSFYQSNGRLAITQAAIAGSSGSWRVGRAVSELVDNVLAAYPISGVVVGASEGDTRINLGRDRFPVGSGDVFLLQSVARDESGRITGEHDAGTLKVHRRHDDATDLRPETLRGTPKIGDRVTRLDVNARAAGNDRVTVAVKGGKGAEPGPLRGVNVYLDNRWVGTTGRSGEISFPLRLGRKYRLMAYRHGYEQATRDIKPAKSGEHFDFALKSYLSQFTVESEPSGAAVYVDDNRVGTTPITKAVAVPLGFHTLRVDAGGDYRPYEEVVEFNKKEEDRTGSNRIFLYQDFLRMGERAEDAHQIDEAIRIYSEAPNEHPDYAELHHRLGQLYFDDKHDVDRAIAEYELVEAVPEVHELVYKQFAVLYTNLGKAYYAKGESLYRGNRDAAAQYFAKAIKALDRARENIRFLPNERHDEAVHDTYYYRALAYHYLYQATKRDALIPKVEFAWQEYQDFFPPALRARPEYEQLRESAEKLAKQVQGG